jgi:UDP-N-acetylmuramoyl-tripeptide--D-alanyl-D-alanine ligase
VNSITADQLVRVTQGHHISGNGKNRLKGVSIDSRTILPGEVFFAIAGDNFDGHDYILSAAKNGAACIIVEKKGPLALPTNVCLIKVHSSIEALGKLASWYRRQLNAKVVAVTGSVGKTTTRQILYQILSHYFRCRQAPGSFNNHIGVPLTLLSADSDDEILLVEIGSNHPGEIEKLAAIANPDIAVITMIAPSHLSGFGSLDNIIKEKVSIAKGLREDGTVYINGDQAQLVEYVNENLNVPVVTFGEKQNCTVRGAELETRGCEGSLKIDGQRVHVPLAGKANLSNVLTAWSVCRDLGISSSDFAESVKTLKPADRRLEIETIGPLTVLNDCYNANPASMANGLSCLKSMASGTNKRKVFIAGDMAELGEQSESLHFQLGRGSASEVIELILAVGCYADQVLRGASRVAGNRLMHAFEKTEQLCDNLHKWIQPDDIILVKGSRCAKLEKVIQRLRERFSNY